VPWSHGFVLDLRPRGSFWNSPSDHETWSIWCHVGIHVDYTSILHSHTPLVPQAWCEANLDSLRLFHQWECLKCNGHGLSTFVCEVALSTQCLVLGEFSKYTWNFSVNNATYQASYTPNTLVQDSGECYLVRGEWWAVSSGWWAVICEQWRKQNIWL
jgi:hypothetical protein